MRQGGTFQIIQSVTCFTLGQKLVCAGDQVKSNREGAILWIRIRMVFEAGPAKCAANLRLVGGLRHTENGSRFPVALP